MRGLLLTFALLAGLAAYAQPAPDSILNALMTDNVKRMAGSGMSNVMQWRVSPQGDSTWIQRWDFYNGLLVKTATPKGTHTLTHNSSGKAVYIRWQPSGISYGQKDYYFTYCGKTLCNATMPDGTAYSFNSQPNNATKTWVVSTPAAHILSRNISFNPGGLPLKEYLKGSMESGDSTVLYTYNDAWQLEKVQRTNEHRKSPKCHDTFLTTYTYGPYSRHPLTVTYQYGHGCSTDKKSGYTRAQPFRWDSTVTYAYNIHKRKGVLGYTKTKDSVEVETYKIKSVRKGRKITETWVRGLQPDGKPNTLTRLRTYDKKTGLPKLETYHWNGAETHRYVFAWTR